MFIKSYWSFITEVRDKTPKHIEDYKPETEENVELEDEIADYIEEVDDLCPRCGELDKDCQCQEKDPYSTNTAHRAPKGELIKTKPKQKFKSE